MCLVQRTKKYSEMFRFAQHDRNEMSNRKTLNANIPEALSERCRTQHA